MTLMKIGSYRIRGRRSAPEWWTNASATDAIRRSASRWPSPSTLAASSRSRQRRLRCRRRYRPLRRRRWHRCATSATPIWSRSCQDSATDTRPAPNSRALPAMPSPPAPSEGRCFFFTPSIHHFLCQTSCLEHYPYSSCSPGTVSSVQFLVYWLDPCWSSPEFIRVYSEVLLIFSPTFIYGSGVDFIYFPFVLILKSWSYLFACAYLGWLHYALFHSPQRFYVSLYFDGPSRKNLIDPSRPFNRVKNTRNFG